MRLRDRLLGFFEAADGADAELAADPLLDVVHQYPETKPEKNKLSLLVY